MMRKIYVGRIADYRKNYRQLLSSDLVFILHRAGWWMLVSGP